MEFAYLTLVVFFAAIWGALFVLRPHLRHIILGMSTILAVVGFVQPILARDYFQPLYALPLAFNMRLEDVMFAFFTGGIASVIYDSLFPKARHQSSQRERTFVFCAVYIFGFAVCLVGTLILGYTGIILGCTLLIVMGGIQIAIRSDLLVNAFLSGLLMMVLVFLSYVTWLTPLYPGVIDQFWSSSLLIAGIPYQEYLWGFAWGFYAGPAYKFARGLTIA
jgi:hypothetical protein